MDKSVLFWVDMITSFEKSINDVPIKLRNDVISDLLDIDFIDDSDLDDIKTAKIAEMSSICNEIITAGSDVTLTDGKTYHFSFTMTDQTQISTLAQKAQSGETFLPWHSDGASCKLYSATDILLIYKAMENVVTYQVTYFNSLRDYINSLKRVKDIIAISYGIQVPEKYQSEVLKALLSNQ